MAPGKPKSSAKPESLKSYWYPDREAISLSEVKTGYSLTDGLAVFFSFVVVPLVGVMVYYFAQSFDQIAAVAAHVEQRSALFLLALLCSVAAFVYWWSRRPRPVYLIDFSTFDAPEKNHIPRDVFVRQTRMSGFFDRPSEEFQEKLLDRTGLGEETYFPDGILSLPPVTNMEAAREEARQVLFTICEELFAKTNTAPTDIDILIVNCSLFNPTPSLCALVVNKFKMRVDIESYNLAGMGCSAGVIAIHLAKQLLQTNANSTALVLSTENMTQNWYKGQEKSMLISNTLFRMGGAAILLSNKRLDGWRAKFQLLHTVRITKSADDKAYESVYQVEDDKGNVGVRLSKDLLDVVGDALKSNLTTLGPLVLPFTEQAKFFINLVRRKWLGQKISAYVPDFRKAFDHFCIHAGGRAVIDGLQENLSLSDYDTEPSRATLYRYGNTSSSSIWYEMNYIVNAGRLQRGEVVWQIAFGSGFKCNSAVWKALKNGRDAHVTTDDE